MYKFSDLFFLIVFLNGLALCTKFAKLWYYSGTSKPQKTARDEYIWNVFVICCPALFVLSVILGYFFYDQAPLLLRGGFNFYSLVELVMFVSFFCLFILGYRGCNNIFDMRYRKDSIINTFKSAHLIVIAYIYIILVPVVNKVTIGEVINFFFGESANIFDEFFSQDIFSVSGGSFLFFNKLLFSLVILAQLHLAKKYALSSQHSYAYFVSLSLAMWFLLFTIGVNTLYIAFMLLDAAGMLTVALIILNEKQGECGHTTVGTMYLFISAVFSCLAIFGMYLVYSVFSTLDINIIFNHLFYGGTISGLPKYKLICGFMMIAIKFFLFFGLVPFHFVTIALMNHVYYPTNFFILVTSKFPVLYIFTKFVILLYMAEAESVINFFTTGFCFSILVGSFLMLRCDRVKNFLSYSSFMGMSFVLLFATQEIQLFFVQMYAYFFIYAISLFAIILYLSSFISAEAYANIVEGGGEIDTMQNLLKASQNVFVRIIDKKTGQAVESSSFTNLVKLAVMLASITLMGIAPTAGFIAKFALIVQAVGLWPVGPVVVGVILYSVAISHLAYFSFFRNISEINITVNSASYKEYRVNIDISDCRWFGWCFISLSAMSFISVLWFF